uniref:Leucine rich repeat containing 14 n=1 Tax=Latimeria chalumnae TaxID=7897 RepID=H2ZSD8_LATCH
MQSLVFLCAQKVVSDHTSFQKALKFIPRELYPVLFKAAFLNQKTLVLHDLVWRWPFQVLNFLQVLRKCRHCERDLIREKPNKLCLQAVIMGVMGYLNKALGDMADFNPSSPSCFRKHRLRVVDLTGLQDDGVGQDTETMGQWSRTVALAKACVEISKLSCEATSATKLYLEVRADLFVNSSSYIVLKDALQASSRFPLRLKCRDFRAEELSIKSTLGLLELLDSGVLRRIDLRYNNLQLSGLNIVLSYVIRFTNLVSL